MTQIRTALVLVDLQKWIVGMPWQPTTGEAVVKACAGLRAGFARSNDPVVLVRYLRADGADGGPAAAANQFVPEAAPGPEDLLVTKNGLDAFEGTDLRERLEALEVGRLLIAGLSTAHGVAATAATALASGYEVDVVSDATASGSPEEHRGALDQLTRLGARTVLAADAAPDVTVG